MSTEEWNCSIPSPRDHFLPVSSKGEVIMMVTYEGDDLQVFRRFHIFRGRALNVLNSFSLSHGMNHMPPERTGSIHMYHLGFTLF